MDMNETLGALAKNGFRVEDKRPEREYIVVSCKTCGARWSMTRPSTGNALALLDHAASHEAQPC